MVAVLFSVLRWGLDPALHWLIVLSGESAVGAKVELASVRTSISSGQLVLDDLAVANPSSPMKNLFEVDQASLVIDTRSLMKSRVTIRDGALERVRFDTRRTTSGELETVPADDTPSALDPLWESIGDLAANWLDDVSDRLTADFTDELQTPRVANELEQRWNQQAVDLRQRAEGLRQQAKEIEADFQEMRKNPLRGIERLPTLQAQLKSVQQEMKSLEREIKQLPQQTKSDRNALDTARKEDERFLRKKLNFGKIDGEGLTQMLLGGPVADNLHSALDWISWVRAKVPHNPVRANAKNRSRGTVVHFSPAGPRFLVERLQLDVLGSMGGEEMQLVGSLTGLSSEPQLLADPTRLVLASTGPMQISMEMISDRRTETPIDRFHLVCPNFAIAEQTLGSNKLAIGMPASHAKLDMEIVLTDDVLEGQIAFHQTSVQLTPVVTGDKNKALLEMLGEALSDVEQVSAEITLSGTVKQPTFQIKSELGSQLSSGINRAIAGLVQERSEALMAKITLQVDAQAEKLTAAKTKFEEELLASLGEHQQLFEQIAAFSNPASQSLPIPQIGDSLRNGLLRK